MQLEKVCDVFSGYAFKSFNSDHKGIPIIKIGNINNNGTIDLDNCQYSTEDPNVKYKSKNGDIYIALSGATTGKIGLMKSNNYYINQRVGIVRIKDNKIPVNYLLFFLQSKTKKILLDAAGAAQPNISPKDIAKYEIDIPSEEKMLSISNELNYLNRAISLKYHELLSLDELIKSRFIEMFKDKGFPIIPLKELSVSKAEYGAGSASIPYEEGRPRYVRITDINDDGTLNDDVVCSVNPQDDVDYKLSYGDFMFARMGATVGKTYAYFKGNEIYAGYLIRYKLDLNKLNPRYLFTYSKLEDYLLWVKNNQSGAAQPGINAKKYDTLPIPVAPIQLQNQFASFVELIDKSKFVVQQQIKELQELLDKKMDEYFSE